MPNASHQTNTQLRCFKDGQLLQLKDVDFGRIDDRMVAYTQLDNTHIRATLDGLYFGGEQVSPDVFTALGLVNAVEDYQRGRKMVCGLRLVIDRKNIRLREQRPLYQLVVYEIGPKQVIYGSEEMHVSGGLM